MNAALNAQVKAEAEPANGVAPSPSGATPVVLETKTTGVPGGVGAAADARSDGQVAVGADNQGVPVRLREDGTN